MIYDLDNLNLTLVRQQRPTDQTRARGYLLNFASSHLRVLVFEQEMAIGETVQMSQDIHTMPALQGPQHGSSFAWNRCRSRVTRINECADVPAAWSMPYLWLCLPAGPVSFESTGMPQASILTQILGLISWLDNSSMSDWKFMHLSMAARLTEAFRTLISPSA